MNNIVKAMESNRSQMAAWFEHMHRHPELSMQEEKTAQYIANLVQQWGYEVVTGVGKHGIVASSTVGDSGPSIGLRADFDALPIQEKNDLPYKSTVDGVAHLCGHDGHSTMLLAAGKYLAETKNFNGTVRLVFQPGEETMEGGPAMIEEEDFAFMLQEKPGTYCILGNGDTPMVHHPEFVFNQDLLPIGAAYWIALTESLLR